MAHKSILVAVSGGLDSMVLLHKLISAQGANRLAVAHVNYGLRGQESDGDEAFVREYCLTYGVLYHVKQVDMQKEMKTRSEGIQEAARNVRYEWFFELMEEHSYDDLATAHHADDALETFFINLLRGAGAHGLSGIQEDELRNIVRPLLDMDRVSIQSYAEKHGIQWREDSSNEKSDYLRNRIRSELIPLLQDLRPGFDKVMLRNMEIQRELAEMLEVNADDYRDRHVVEEGGRLRITTTGENGELSILHRLLSPYGFNASQIRDMIEPGQSGRQIFSSSHMVTGHRGSLILDPLMIPAGQVVIHSSEQLESDSGLLKCELLSEAPQEFDSNPEVAFLDAALPFPWTIRIWEPGDRFHPLGMQGTKTISDFLTDLQMDRAKKAQVKVLCVEGQIAWVIGLRISERHKAIAGKPCWLLSSV